MSYQDIGSELGALVDQKNRVYGDAFGKAGEFLKLLYPNGIKIEQYDDMLALVRVFDKQMRIATDRDALGESPWRDIGGYSLLATERVERKRAVAESYSELGNAKNAVVSVNK